MPLPPALLLDADMVLLDYLEHFSRYLREQHALHPAVPCSEEGNYAMTTMYPQLGQSGLIAYIQEMARDRRYYASVPFLPGVKRGLAELSRQLPGVPFICVTACGEEAITRVMRLENLAPLALDDVITLPLHASKKDVLETFEPGCWFVDDMPHHVADAEELGHYGILFHQPYNTTVPVRRRAREWEDVTAMICGAIPPPALTCL